MRSYYHAELEVGTDSSGEVSAEIRREIPTDKHGIYLGNRLCKDLQRFMQGKDKRGNGGFDSMLEGHKKRHDEKSGLDFAEHPVKVKLDEVVWSPSFGGEVSRKITIEQTYCNDNFGQGVMPKIVRSLRHGLKLGTKCAVASLAYFGTRAIIGGDVREIFSVDKPENLLQTMDMLAYTVPISLPLIQAYIKSPHNLFQINDNTHNNPGLGMRI